MKQTTRLLLVLIVAALFLSACGVAGRNALIGKWADATSGTQLEFTTDGRMRQTNTAQPGTSEINYQFVNDNTVLLKIGGASGQQDQSIAFAVDSDQLTLDLGEGQQLVLKRVK
jgi:hypothetical protein